MKKVRIKQIDCIIYTMSITYYLLYYFIENTIIIWCLKNFYFVSKIINIYFYYFITLFLYILINNFYIIISQFFFLKYFIDIFIKIINNWEIFFYIVFIFRF